MATTLYFPLTATHRLAEHAAASPEHHRSFTENTDRRPCSGALEWILDNGTYLMSGGRPALLTDPDDPTSNEVVYADGWNPAQDDVPHAAHTDLGGDDFVEHLHLHEPLIPGGLTLLELLRGGVVQNARFLVLTVGDDGALTFSPQGPRQA